MATTRFTVHTSLSPSEVMAVITDFGPERSRWWPNVDDAHFSVHGQGPDWAEVTEGTGMGWERERYVGRRLRHRHNRHSRIESVGAGQWLAVRARVSSGGHRPARLAYSAAELVQGETDRRLAPNRGAARTA